MATAFAPAVLHAVVLGALDRKTVERLAKKHLRPRRPLAELPREELARLVVLAVPAQERLAAALAAELNRVCATERSLVASIPAGEVEEKLGSLAVLRFKRHGSKFVWALVEDARPEVARLAGKVCREYLDETHKLNLARAQARSLGAEAPLATFEALYREAAARVLHLEEALAAAQNERRRLADEAQGQQAPVRVPAAARPVPAVHTRQAPAPAVGPPPSRDLTSQVRRLEKKLAACLAERDQARLEVARAGELAEEAQRLRGTIDSLRELRAHELKKAAEVAPPEQLPQAPLVAPPRRGATPRGALRVGVFIDAANLAGAARRLHQRGVDFRRLLPVLAASRRLVEARLYAIDKGDAGFAAFAQTLREAGYKIMSKKPRQFDDGTVKADWDVGMVVEILSLQDKLEVVVLGSGDGDFVPLVSALKQAGVRVEVAVFRARAASELLRVADGVVDLDETFLEGP